MDLEVLNRFKNFKLSGSEAAEVELTQNDVCLSKKDCERSIVGRIFGENIVNFTGLRQTMEKLWCTEGTLRVVELKSKMYQFIFSKEAERQRVLEKRPWTFDNQLLVLHPWRDNIDLEEAAFFSSQIWIQVWSIPIQWLSSETGWKIGKIFNNCYNVVIPENGSREGRFVKILAEVDLHKPLIRGTTICCDGEKRWVNFKYESLPLFCFYCGKLGHGEKSCTAKMSDVKIGKLDEGQYGIWLRATSLRAHYKGWGVWKKDLNSNSTGRGEGAKEVNTTSSAGGPTLIKVVETSKAFGMDDNVGKNVKNISDGRELGRVEGLGTKLEHTEGRVDSVNMIVTKVMQGMGGEKGEGFSDEIEMRENGEGRRVLGKLDQNCAQRELPQVGSWKRKARVKGKAVKGDLGGGKENKEDENRHIGKRGFWLVDEDDLMEELDQCSKKQKSGQDASKPAEQVVEVASQKWAQVYQ